jgi:hypothetical protein
MLMFLSSRLLTMRAAGTVRLRRSSCYMSRRRPRLTLQDTSKRDHEHRRGDRGRSSYRQEPPRETGTDGTGTGRRRRMRRLRIRLCSPATELCCGLIPNRALSERDISRGRKSIVQRLRARKARFARLVLSLPQWDDLSNQPILALGRESIAVAWWHYSSSMRFDHRCFIVKNTKPRCFC